MTKDPERLAKVQAGVRSEATTALKDCVHEQFRVDANVNRLIDSGLHSAEIRITCVQCGEPFRFVGLPAGLDFARPTVSIDELELHAPIEPEIEKRLRADVRFVVPKILTRN